MHADSVSVGTAEAAPGEADDGWFEATAMPTGGSERLPVTVINGRDAGPTLWVTGGVHGDEATGVATAHEVARVFREVVAGDASDASNGERDASDEDPTLAGAVVVVPVVNPAGVRRNVRTSYYGGDDPNRYFPDIERDDSRPPDTQERIDTALFEAIEGSADLLIDCHTAQVGSVPFVIRDRVLYGDERSEAEAETLADDLERLAEAVGLPLITEYPAEEYLGQSLQRSTAGAATNTAGVPAVTLELGGHSVVERDARAAGVAGVVSAAVEFGVLESRPAGVGEAGATVPSAPVEYPVHRFVGPRTETAGLLRYVVEPGEAVEAGEAIAEVVDSHGRVVDRVETERDGYVLGYSEGLAAYEGQAVASMGVRDDGELVVPREE